MSISGQINELKMQRDCTKWRISELIKEDDYESVARYALEVVEYDKKIKELKEE